MMKKHILKFIISGCLCCVSYNSIAQNTIDIETQTLEEDKKSTQAVAITTYPQRYGLRVGLDLFRTTRSFYDKSYKGFEVTGDYRLTQKLFAAIEVGHDNLSKNLNSYGYTGTGMFAKLGIDYNFYENWLSEEDMMYVGARYGYSNFSQTLDWYQPYTTNPYFSTERIDINKKYSGLSAHWLEFVAGIKAKMFSNVFMGFTMRLTGLVAQKQPDGFENQYIPGFNRKYSGAIGVDFNYTVSYLIPLTTKKKKVKKDELNNELNEQPKSSETEDLDFINKNKKHVK